MYPHQIQIQKDEYKKRNYLARWLIHKTKQNIWGLSEASNTTLTWERNLEFDVESWLFRQNTDRLFFYGAPGGV